MGRITDVFRSPLVFAALASAALAVAWHCWPRAEPRADAGRPARAFTARQLGPSPREVVRAVGRRGYPSPPDAVPE